MKCVRNVGERRNENEEKRERTKLNKQQKKRKVSAIA